MGYTNIYGVSGWTGPRPVRPAAPELIDGRAIAATVREQVAGGVAALVARTGRRPGLATILVGDDAASAIYVAGKQKACREVGIEPFDVRLPATASWHDVATAIHRLNRDEAVSGILCQLPLPAHLDGAELTGLIDPGKDVDGLTAESTGRLSLGLPGLRPCTPAGVMVLLDRAGVALRGAEALVIGRSNLFGRPMAQLLLAADATVTLAHRHSQRLPEVCRRADVVVVAVGRDRMVKRDWIKQDAVVVDVGINRTDDGLHGDVDQEDIADRARAMTPVPGGVGPMTIAMLLHNTLQAATAAAEVPQP
jgi:methylenetetrahydrofolate dehydrogenase (NADP+)/methenyltetrahydrofolate cyclohydrolase